MHGTVGLHVMNTVGLHDMGFSAVVHGSETDGAANGLARGIKTRVT